MSIINRFALLLVVCTLFISNTIFAQNQKILPGQVTAIVTLSYAQGFSEKTLDQYLMQKYNVNIRGLTQSQGRYLIRVFQGTNPPKPSMIIEETKVTSPAIIQKPIKYYNKENPITASILEEGMAKRFHLIDGNIIQGEIVKIEDNVCQIETIDGLLFIPSEDILEETASVTKKDETRYIGPVLKETLEEIILRSKYGDVVISKRDVKEMDRYHGGRLVSWAEEKKTFFRGEVVLTDILMDPTAFPLDPHTFYVSGLSIGYGFTDNFMIRTKFGSDFSGDLNLHPMYQLYLRQSGTSRRAAAIGMQMFSHHPMESLVAKYAKYVKDFTGVTFDEIEGVTTGDILHTDSDKMMYWELYYVLSSRRSLATHRGEIGWHIGFRTNSLALQQPKLNTGYEWDEFFPFRIWSGFEYDLTKNLKLAVLIWADNGHKFRTFSQAWEDYFVETPLIFDSKEGEYRTVDFDFGFLYAISETFRVGIHFQDPFLVFYWEFFEL